MPRPLRPPVLLLVASCWAASAAAQIQLSPANAPPEIREAILRAQRGGGPPGQPSPESPKPPENKGDGKKPDDKKPDDKPADASAAKPVTRPDAPPRPPDPRELEAKPDASGRVTFSFHGQPWADVLQWLANVSDLSLDWRELPGDYLNLTTRRAYTLAEARDLVNRHLQARGYTLLLSGEVLSVFKLDALDPSLVPRVDEEALYDLPPHDVVKLSLDVPAGLEPKQAVEDVKQALGPHAKVVPLAATKRLLLIDTVANLRMVAALLSDERVAAEGRQSPREFVLRYVQAPDVIDTLYVVLGLDPNSRPSQMELQMQQQKLQLMSELSQRGKDVMSLLQKDGPPVYLAYNRQRNSVLANAPDAEMRIIERTIQALDVPAPGAEGVADGPAKRSFRSYRLKTIEPQAVINTLRDIGDLAPRTELQGDNESKTLFARASESDHKKIDALIRELDGAETVVEVFWLRRLPAEAVAGSIQSLLIEKPKKKQENDYPFFYLGRSDRDDEEKPSTSLRVDADVENNRLVVRGAPAELDEVRDLLAKLGEPVDERPAPGRVRVIDGLSPEDTRRMLDALRSEWPTIGGGADLVLPADEEPEPAESPEGKRAAAPPDQTTGRFGDSPFRLIGSGEGARPPVTVRIDGTGRLVLRSADPAALDRAETFLADFAPAPKRYEVYKVRNRSPDDIVASLEVYFKEFLEDDNEQVLDWWGRVRGVSKEEEPVRLSRRKPLRFLSDDWSSTILVANASPAQLAEIERLIQAWDRQPIDDRVITRRTATVKLRYAKAPSVVAALKEVYRDLLSRGDKEFDTQERKAAGGSTRYLTQIRYGTDGTSEPAFIAFDGLLSLGADEAANVVIVSARDEVFESVMDAIRDLDERARPTTAVQVVSVGGGVAMTEVRRALLRALSDPSTQRGGDNEDRRGEGRRFDRRR